MSNDVIKFIIQDTWNIVATLRTPPLNKHAESIATNVAKSISEFFKRMPTGFRQDSYIKERVDEASRLRRSCISELEDKDPAWITASLCESFVMGHTPMKSDDADTLMGIVFGFIKETLPDNNETRIALLNTLKEHAAKDPPKQTKIGNLNINM